MADEHLPMTADMHTMMEELLKNQHMTEELLDALLHDHVSKRCHCPLRDSVCCSDLLSVWISSSIIITVVTTYKCLRNKLSIQSPCLV
jgi:hypothetical protein